MERDVDAHFWVPGAQELTVAELCVEVGLDGLVFEPNPGPCLRERWPIEGTRVVRRNLTQAVDIHRTPHGLEIRVRDTLCNRTAQFALLLAMRASYLAHRLCRHGRVTSA